GMAIAARDQATLLINLVGPTVDGLQILQQLINELRATGHWTALSPPSQRAIARSINPLGGTVSEQREQNQNLGQDADGDLGAVQGTAQGAAQGTVQGTVITRSIQRTLESSPPALNLAVLEYQRQWPKIVLHCSNLDHDAAEALAAPYPIWLADTIETGVKIAVDLSV
ncbi:MAG: hypothetical protein AAGF75_14075, partial [Cyanobacteria bacterium P01_H01_bin.130]